jgi:hypothetical protein
VNKNRWFTRPTLGEEGHDDFKKKRTKLFDRGRDALTLQEMFPHMQAYDREKFAAMSDADCSHLQDINFCIKKAKIDAVAKKL